MSRFTKRLPKRKGAAMVTTLGVMTLVAVAAASFISSSTSAMRVSNRQMLDVQTTHLCEAGVQAQLRNLWRPFKINQNFDAMEAACAGATEASPRASLGAALPNVGRYAAGVVRFFQPAGNPYQRLVTIRSVGYVDRNNNGTLDAGEASKTVDVTANYELARSQVFDYTYFVNNYGWMSGFGPNDLIVNGDMRANGNFDFTGGSPTVNGSVYASLNDKLTPQAPGLVNSAPVKWANATYSANAGAQNRWRQVYNPAVHGAKGSAQYEQWRDFVFDTDGSIVNGQTSGAILGDSTGIKNWTRTSSGTGPTTNVLDTRATEEIVMPDLSDINRYITLSQAYRDPKATYGDGTANPLYNQPAYVEVWNTSTSSYQRISTNGVVTGSAALVGTDAKPIKIHGPVTFTQDCVIKGTVEGQGTIYTGRNCHVVGSLKYKNGPDFRGGNMTTIDNANEKKDMLALASRGSVIMGNPTTFTASSPLQYMTPPFTKGRYDENGNWIPPYNANDIDASGRRKYQSVMSDAVINSLAEGVNQIDAILYTNFVGGGNIGTSGGGVTFNGTIISKDEAMVVFSLPMRMNYDHRIRERAVSSNPLIDLQLPRSPVMLRSTWQDRGFTFVNH